MKRNAKRCPGSGVAPFPALPSLVLLTRSQLIALSIGTVYIESIIGWHNLDKHE